MPRWPLVLPIVLAATPAWALKPGEHRALAEAACTNSGLPDAFCRKLGQAVYETDYREWTDLSAHAQTPAGSDRCTAADASVQRVDALARSVTAAAASGDLATAATDLGRALHTLQDECAHHGMTNEQHAYFSLDSTCGGELQSPDVTPEAIACATARTQRAMTAAAAALAGTDWSRVDWLCEGTSNGDSSTSTDTCAQASLPTPFQACDFLAEYKRWDGRDTTWNAAIVGPALEDAFAAGLRGGPVASSICATPGAIDPIAPAATLSTSDVSCGLTDIGCLGKVDGTGDGGADPYGDPPAATAAGGCSTGAGAGWLLALVSLVLSSRSRSRRR
ncbi:MAG: hypothetical protein ACM31C_25830 [Acidobacteriota bacterium]